MNQQTGSDIVPPDLRNGALFLFLSPTPSESATPSITPSRSPSSSATASPSASASSAITPSATSKSSTKDSQNVSSESPVPLNPDPNLPTESFTPGVSTTISESPTPSMSFGSDGGPGTTPLISPGTGSSPIVSAEATSSVGASFTPSPTVLSTSSATPSITAGGNVSASISSYPGAIRSPSLTTGVTPTTTASALPSISPSVTASTTSSATPSISSSVTPSISSALSVAASISTTPSTTALISVSPSDTTSPSPVLCALKTTITRDGFKGECTCEDSEGVEDYRGALLDVWFTTGISATAVTEQQTCAEEGWKTICERHRSELHSGTDHTTSRDHMWACALQSSRGLDPELYRTAVVYAKEIGGAPPALLHGEVAPYIELSYDQIKAGCYGRRNDGHTSNTHRATLFLGIGSDNDSYKCMKTCIEQEMAANGGCDQYWDPTVDFPGDPWSGYSSSWVSPFFPGCCSNCGGEIPHSVFKYCSIISTGLPWDPLWWNA